MKKKKVVLGVFASVFALSSSLFFISEKKKKKAKEKTLSYVDRLKTKLNTIKNEIQKKIN